MNSGRKKFEKHKSVIMFFANIVGVIPKTFRLWLFRFFRNTGGIVGLLIRYILIRKLTKECGDNVSIHPGVFIFNVDEISFGNNISIHPMCYLEGQGGLSIMDDVSIAHSCSILTTNHDWSDNTISIKYNPTIDNPVLIENDVWVGCGVRILSGVRIGSRSVVAAGAVVNKDVLSGTIVGGVPAKLLKNI